MPYHAAVVVLASVMLAGAAPQEQSVRDLTTALAAAEPDARARAACGLRDKGSEAEGAVPALVTLLADGAPVDASSCGQRWFKGRNGDQLITPGEAAASALAAIGSPALQPAIDTLRSPSWIARRNAAWLVGVLDREQGVDPLIGALKDPDARVRESAAWALGVIGNERAMEPLLGALKDAEAGVRRNAAWAIGVIGG